VSKKLAVKGHRRCMWVINKEQAEEVSSTGRQLAESVSVEGTKHRKQRTSVRKIYMKET
jgi:hypothetical protein